MVARRLREVRERIGTAAERSGRAASEVTLVAIGKTHPPEVLREAYEAGQRIFGENRAQELVEKAPALPDDVDWHFVGHLQRNKIRLVRPVVKLLHSMDRRDLAATWLKGPGTAPPVLIEVNVGAEPQKSGVLLDDVEAMVEHCVGLGVDVRGLMCVPPVCDDPEQVRPYFRALAGSRDHLRDRWESITELSMGMSDDYEVAIEEGSTMVRLGRAIFGPRHG